MLNEARNSLGITLWMIMDLARDTDRVSQECAKVPALRESIRKFVELYAADKAWLDARRNKADTKAAECRTKADVDLLFVILKYSFNE